MIYPPHVKSVTERKVILKDGTIESEMVVGIDLPVTQLNIHYDEEALNAVLRWAGRLVEGADVTRVVVQYHDRD
jgi:hypothetical protein